MSIAVEVADLPEVLAPLDPAAFVCTCAPGARPKIVHALITAAEGRLTAAVGRGTVSNVVDGSPVTLVFPGATSNDMSLLVDAEAESVTDDDTALSMRPTGAVWHRSAHGAGS